MNTLDPKTEAQILITRERYRERERLARVQRVTGSWFAVGYAVGMLSLVVDPRGVGYAAGYVLGKVWATITGAF